jgi:hypothetical protein
VVVTTASVIAPAACERGAEDAGERETPTSDQDVADAIAPLELTPSQPKLVRTTSRALGSRMRRAGRRAAAAARDIVTGLYTEAFLDPANWEAGTYDDAFVDFSRAARDEAGRRTALLTAGAEAAERYDEIRAIAGRIATKILLDRNGVPTLMVSSVTFAAAALGPDPQTLRSRGRFLFERAGSGWKIVSFHVIRSDAPREAAGGSSAPVSRWP